MLEGRGGLGREAAVERLREHKQRLMEKRAAEIVAAFNPHAFRYLSYSLILDRSQSIFHIIFRQQGVIHGAFGYPYPSCVYI